jgi:hypothetical protein
VRRGEREATAVLQDHPGARLARGLIEGLVNDTDLGLVRRVYDRAATAEVTLNRVMAGTEEIERFWLGYLAALPDAKLVVDHSIALEEPGRPVRASTRWRLAGTHTGHGAFGPPTSAKVMILGITQHHLVGGRVVAEWTVVDELATHRMIGLQAG